jgi:predicted acyl esterase
MRFRLSWKKAVAARPAPRWRMALLLLAVTTAVAACGPVAAAPSGGAAGSSPAAPGTGPASASGPAGSSQPTPTPTGAAAESKITARDGTVLTAVLATPTGPGRHPLAVIPSAWGFEAGVFGEQTNALAKRGYVVVTYNPRGFFSSGGTTDVASPLDVSDVSDVITWALAHTPADPERIGVAGLSYGAGIALLASAADPRIKAVASLSGWSDFGYSLYSANTRHKAAVASLTSFQQLTGRRSADFQTFLDNYTAGRDMQDVLAWGKVRSPDTYLGAINDHQPAIFMSSAYGDNYFSPIPQISFFTALTGPKTFQIAPGDHGTNEITGLLSMSNQVWSAAWDWFDRYLLPGSAAVSAPAPAAVQLTTDAGAVETYPDWAAVTRSTTAMRLGPAFLGTGELSPTAATGGWSTPIQSGTDTTANAGTILITGALVGITHLPPALRLETVDRRYGAVWQTAPGFVTQRLRGIPTMQLTMTPNVDSGTVVAYLYDTSPTGDSTMISKAVYTYLQVTPDKPLTATLTFDPVAADVLPGHHLSLVIDTKDDLYYDMDRSGGTVAFSSPSDGPSQLILPLG